VTALSEADYRGVLAVLSEASTVEGPTPFTKPVLEALRRLVPCDVVTYHERLEPSGRRHLRYVGEPRGEVTPEIRAAVRRHWSSDPLTVPYDGARKYSDFLSRREYHRLGMYQEASRPLRIEYMMSLWLDPHGADMARLEFDRETKDFSERDRAVLDVLRPHLAQFRANAVRRRRAGGSLAGRLTPREREIIDLVAKGHQNSEIAAILWISTETVRKHLENAYEKLGVHTRTAAVAAVRPVSRGRSG
jgi:DNA-binding CsgD family transcriptional regulator